MSLRRTLDTLSATVGRAASVPLSASCIVNRAEILSLVERAKAELPAELDEAAALLVAHQQVIEDAENDRDQLLADARAQVEELVSEAAVVATANARAQQILDAAREEAARLLRQADEYCDGKLAAFETDLERLTGQVRRGRDRLRERSDLDDLRRGLAPQGREAQGREPEVEGKTVLPVTGAIDMAAVARATRPAARGASAADEPYDGQAQASPGSEHDDDIPDDPFPTQGGRREGASRVIDLTAVEEGATTGR
ncbi:hypothetical protein ACIB24_11960 [Spongisporangium articulatum]|uniref:ATP synthase F0 subunit B n=1 Tax=Spongisporangium articulatum TaxID=3362603 RepID=A0ABW8AN23_9ACTN